MSLQDYYNVDDDGASPLNGSSWLAQTFDAGANYDLSSVKIELYKGFGASGTITVSIQGVDGSNLPDGTDIDSVTGTTDIDSLPLGPPFSEPTEWREITLSSTVSITSGTRYAIVVRSDDLVYWRQDSTAGYTNGEYCYSSNAGVSWSSASADFMFETYGTTVSANPVYMAGSSGGVSDGSGNITITTVVSISGTGSGVGGGSGNVSVATAIHISGIAPGIGDGNAILIVQNLPSNDSVNVVRRIIAIGNDQVWIEDI